MQSKQPDEAPAEHVLGAALLIQSVRKSGVALYMRSFAWLNRTEVSPGRASIFSGIPVGMFVFIAVRTLAILFFADANMSEGIMRLPGVRGTIPNIATQ